LIVPPQPSLLSPQKWLPGQGVPVMQAPSQQIGRAANALGRTGLLTREGAKRASQAQRTQEASEAAPRVCYGEGASEGIESFRIHGVLF
jgi:hypothetical protein